jgi:murein DD-endopeptidase MepM/ murein hydrolase activator NlpD
LVGVAAGILLLPATPASATSPPPLPHLPPLPVPTPTAPAPPSTPVALPLPLTSAVSVTAPPPVIPASVPGWPVGTVPTGAQALALVAGKLGQQGASDPGPADQDQQGPRDTGADRQPARESSRQEYAMTMQVEALSASQDATDAFQAGGGSGQFGWPENYRIMTQGFGCTSLGLAPLNAGCPTGHFHTGDDVAGPNRADVFAADTGVVRVFAGTAGYGNYAIITHGNGFATLYGHLHDFVVNDGDLVQRGDPIAHEGSTGNSTGPHLHFEVRQTGAYSDPCPFLEGCLRGGITPLISAVPSVSGNSASGRSSPPASRRSAHLASF